MGTKILMIALLSSLILLTGCSKPPSVDDPDVQKLVLQVSKNAIKQQLLKAYAVKHTGMTVSAMLRSGGVPGLSLASWEAAYNQNQVCKAVIDELNQKVDSLQPMIEGVRILAKDKELKQIKFAFSIKLNNGNSIPFTGEAQYTEDGQLYVQAAINESQIEGIR